MKAANWAVTSSCTFAFISSLFLASISCNCFSRALTACSFAGSSEVLELSLALPNREARRDLVSTLLLSLVEIVEKVTQLMTQNRVISDRLTSKWPMKTGSFRTGHSLYGVIPDHFHPGTSVFSGWTRSLHMSSPCTGRNLHVYATFPCQRRWLNSPSYVPSTDSSKFYIIFYTFADFCEVHHSPSLVGVQLLINTRRSVCAMNWIIPPIVSLFHHISCSHVDGF